MGAQVPGDVHPSRIIGEQTNHMNRVAGLQEVSTKKKQAILFKCVYIKSCNSIMSIINIHPQKC